MKFAQFMSSAAGRGTRIVAGLALIIVGGLLMFTFNNLIGGLVLALVGLVPLLAGALNVCLLAPLLGAPFSGSKVHAQ